MAAMANVDSVALQFEKVRDKIPLMYERDDILATMIRERGDVEKVSTRNMRVPLLMSPGGLAGQATMDGDDLGRGSGSNYQVAELSPLFLRFNIEVTKLVEYATNASEKAIEKAAKREIKNGMAQFRAFIDKYTQTSGTASLGTVASISSNDVTTAAPTFAQLFYKGQIVQVYDTTFATDRGDAIITGIDFTTGILTAGAGWPGGTAATDELVVHGAAGTNPVGLFGVKYHQSNAATGTWQNLNRATFPEIRTPRVNAANAGLSPAHVRLAMNLVRKALGINALKDGQVIAYMNVEQEQAWEALGITISEIIRQGSNQTQPDLLFSKSGTMGGAPIKSSINADPSRIDFIALKHWGRAVMQEIDYLEMGGQTIFPVYGASGGLASAYLFYFITGFQYFTDSPRNGVYVDTLAKPTGYL